MAKRTKRDYTKFTGTDDRQADGFFDAPQSKRTRTQSARVVSIPLSQIIPDRFQPRPLLPAGLKELFFTNQADCYLTARMWLDWARKNPAIAAQVGKLIEMGTTFDQHGQIKPATGCWIQIDDRTMFQLETGERRFWAAALVAARSGFEEEPQLEVREIAAPSRERQIIENQHAEQPSAVGRAREIAALILGSLDIHPDVNIVDEYDYFHKALEIKRMPQGLWSQIEAIMGIRRPQMVRLLNLLVLPSELLAQADLYRIPERVLREVIARPEQDWDLALGAAVDLGLSHEDVALIDLQERASHKKTSKPGVKLKQTPYQKAARRVKSFIKLASRSEIRNNVGAVATELFAEFHDLQELIDAADLLEELVTQLRLRVQDDDY
ncbi:MAG: hypothetical protein MUO76_17985 [Anaerolineaceae bacterium]|nr:hypothetical protein [Anaerolineaceae bacterium]